MIRRLSGTIVDINLSSVILEVRGVGYLIHTNAPAQYALMSAANFFTHLAVRENSLDLYGFADRDTLQVFEWLIDLPKIGPKSALQILTQADLSLLREAVANNDPAYLSKLSGIGKKSAEKVVAGLKEKFADLEYVGELSSAATPEGPGHTTDTIDALVALGYTAQDARRVVIEVSASNPSFSSSSDLIKLALRLLNSR